MGTFGNGSVTGPVCCRNSVHIALTKHAVVIEGDQKAGVVTDLPFLAAAGLFSNLEGRWHRKQSLQCLLYCRKSRMVVRRIVQRIVDAEESQLR